MRRHNEQATRLPVLAKKDKIGMKCAQLASEIGLRRDDSSRMDVLCPMCEARMRPGLSVN